MLFMPLDLELDNRRNICDEYIIKNCFIDSLNFDMLKCIYIWYTGRLGCVNMVQILPLFKLL